MSDSDTDNRSATSTKSGNGLSKNKRFPQQQQAPRVQIGIEELKGFYYVYGRPDQAQVSRKTTEGKIAHHVASWREALALSHVASLYQHCPP
jgi:hypothetical protein